jgi:ubiquinone biosynthesis protein COQ4
MSLTSTTSIPLPMFDVRRAGRAIAALARDPDDIPQAFTVIEALSGTAPHRLYRAFSRSEAGAKMLRERPNIVDRLNDRAALRALPEGTLGRAYLDFVERAGIDAEGIRVAAEKGMMDRPRVAAFEYVHDRMRDTHDLWHTATGYKSDVVGESGLLAFYLAQNWNVGIALIVATALWKGRNTDAQAVILDGFRRGRAAAWLPAQDWESMLAMPLTEVRRLLGLGDAPRYAQVPAAEYRRAVTAL